MSKETNIKKILEIHNEIKEVVLDSGVQEPQFNFAIKKLERESENYLKILLEWLINLKRNEYKAIKDLLKEFSGWNNFNINHMPEQIMLRRKQKILRATWHARPRPIRSKNEQVQNMHTSKTEQDSS